MARERGRGSECVFVWCGTATFTAPFGSAGSCFWSLGAVYPLANPWQIFLFMSLMPAAEGRKKHTAKYTQTHTCTHKHSHTRTHSSHFEVHMNSYSGSQANPSNNPHNKQQQQQQLTKGLQLQSGLPHTSLSSCLLFISS